MGIRLVRFPRGQVYSSDGGETTSNTITVMQENDFKVGDIVYCDIDGIFKKALAEDTKRIEVIGFVSNIKDTMTFDILIVGKMTTDKWSSYLNGQVIYLSETIPGDTVNNPIIWRKPVAIKIPDGIIVNIQRADMLGRGYDGPSGSGSGSRGYYTKAQIDTMINDLKVLISKGDE